MPETLDDRPAPGAAPAARPPSLRALLRSDRTALLGAPATRRAAALGRVRTITNPSLRAAMLLRVTATVPRWLAFLPRNALITLHRSDCLLPMDLGPDLRLPAPTGIVCGRMRTGRSLTLGRDVTFGGARDGVPPLDVGDDVRVGTGATVLIDGPAVPSGTDVPDDAFVFRSVWVAGATREAVAAPGGAEADVGAGASVVRLLRADYVAAAGAATGLRGAVAMVGRFVTNPSLHACVLIRLAGPSGVRPRGLWRALLRWKHDIHLAPGVSIAGGLDLPHPVDLTIGPGTVIGANATLTHRVRFETAPGAPAPRIGDRVLVYPSVVFRPGTVVGDDVIVGAYSAVDGTVDDGAIVRGRRPTGPAKAFAHPR